MLVLIRLNLLRILIQLQWGTDLRVTTTCILTRNVFPITFPVFALFLDTFVRFSFRQFSPVFIALQVLQAVSPASPVAQPRRLVEKRLK